MSAETPLIDIRPDHWEIVQRILQEHVPNLEVWAFGSRAKWNAKAFSDLDLAIITDEPLPIDTRAALNEALSESDLPWKVDVVDWASISKEFKDIIEQDKVVVQCYSGPVGDGKHKQNKCETSKMLAPWKNLTLGEFVRLQRGYDLTSEQREVGEFPVMGSAGKNGTHSAYKSAGPGVVIGRSGSSMGSVHFTESNYWPHNTCLYVTDFLGNDPRFVYYFLGAQNLAGYNSGSAQPSLNRNFIYNKTILVPSVAEQQAISHILGTLDDKIELNRKQNETLEEMARALFKAWFVDFEPVRAKMEGRWKRGQSLPGMPAHLYDLFPDRMVESESGEIPDGWHVLSFEDVASQRKEVVKPEDFPNDMFSHYSIPAFDAGRMPVCELGESIRSNKSVVRDGFVLISKLNPHIPRVWNIGEAGASAVCSTEFTVWEAKEPANGAFLYCLASLDVFNEALCQLVTGTSNSHQRVKPEQFKGIRVFSAVEDLISGFSMAAAAILESTYKRRIESADLSRIRDVLLPKLVSGELRISEAERFLDKRGVWL